MNTHIKYLFVLFISMFCFGACQNEDFENNSHNSQFSTSSDFIRLMDDSTQVAGNLSVIASSSEVDLKWNVPMDCNLDTTSTKLVLTKGQGTLLIKWNKKTGEGTYGPTNTAYEGGVLISSGEKSKYIPLYWTESLDSTKVTEQLQIMTRAGEGLPRVASVSLHPSGNVTMDQDNGGSVYVAFAETPVVSIDATGITSDTHIDKTKIKNMITEPGIVEFTWTAEKAPNFNFVRTVKFSASETAFVTAKLTYMVPDSGEPIYKFVSSAPLSGGTLPATNASVDVVVYTNKEWSLESDLNLAPPTSDPNAFGPENKRLTIPIMDNPDVNSRTVTITVKSQENEKDVLTFTQLGLGQIGTFEFVSSDPVDNTTIPGDATEISVTVKTDLAWYLDCNICNPISFEAVPLSTQTKSYTIPANTTVTNRIITLTVSSGNPNTEKKLQFIQLPKNGNPDFTLIYSSSNLPIGNIPSAGATYQFEFTGTYTGGVQVRAVIDGVPQVPGQLVTDKKPQCSVPVNTLNVTRDIKFEYKRADGDWMALPALTDRLQDGNNGGDNPGGNVTPGKILPPGDVPEDGKNYFCTFKGTGNVIFRALRNGTEVSRSDEGTATATGVNLSVIIPPLGNTSNSTISFEYSVDGGKNWINMNDDRAQNQTYVVVDTPVMKEFPAKNASASFGIRGTSQKIVTINAYSSGVLIGSASTYPTPEGTKLIVPIEDNPGPSYRLVSFSWTVDGVHWVSTTPIKQLAP